LTFDGEVVMSIKLRKLEEQVIVITGAEVMVKQRASIRVEGVK
jgi:hypothetical protein